MPEARHRLGRGRVPPPARATLELLADTGVDVRYTNRRSALFSTAARRWSRTGACASRRASSRTRSPARRTSRCKPRGSVSVPLVLREREVYYGTGFDVLYVRDPESAAGSVPTSRAWRRPSCEGLPNIDFIMSMGLPEDAPQGVDDLVQVVAMLGHAQASAGRAALARARQDQEMAAVCGREGTSACSPCRGRMHDRTRSPRSSAAPISSAHLRRTADMGATGPRSVAGSVLVGNAETLSGLVLHHTSTAGRRSSTAVAIPARHGHAHDDRPVRFARRALAPAVGTDMARHYGLPSFSYAGMSTPKVLDKQWRRRGGAQHGLRLPLASDAAARRGLPRVGSAERLRIHRPGRQARRLRAPVHAPTTVDDYSHRQDQATGATSGRSTARRHHREFWTPRCSTTTCTTAGPPRARRRSATRPARLADLLAAAALRASAEQDARLDALLDEALAKPGARV